MSGFWILDRHDNPLTWVSMARPFAARRGDDRPDERASDFAYRLGDLACLAGLVNALQLRLDRLEQIEARLGAEAGQQVTQDQHDGEPLAVVGNADAADVAKRSIHVLGDTIELSGGVTLHSRAIRIVQSQPVWPVICHPLDPHGVEKVSSCSDDGKGHAGVVSAYVGNQRFIEGEGRKSPTSERQSGVVFDGHDGSSPVDPVPDTDPERQR